MTERAFLPWVVLATGWGLLAYPYSFVLRRLAEQWMTDGNDTRRPCA